MWVLGDKGYVSAADARTLAAETGVQLVAARRANQVPNTWAEQQALAQYRQTIETVNSQAEKMGVERLYARTNADLEIKVGASVLALVFRNLHKVPDADTGSPLSWTA